MIITDQEYEVLVNEVAERLRDMVYSRAYISADHMLRRLCFVKGIPDSDHDTNKITFSMDIEMCYGDFRQIIARMRREVK